MVKRLDEAFGRLLDALKSLGMQDDTIILLHQIMGVISKPGIRNIKDQHMRVLYVFQLRFMEEFLPVEVKSLSW